MMQVGFSLLLFASFEGFIIPHAALNISTRQVAATGWA